MHTFKNNLINLLCLALIGGLAACEETVTNFKVKNHPSVIVLNGILYPDSIVKVHLSRSGSINQTDESLTVIDDASVTLFENDALIGNLTYTSNGYYALAGFKPKPGSLYAIDAEAAGFDKVHAQTLMPLPHLFSFVDSTRMNVNDYGYVSEYLQMTFSIPNQVLADDYYAVSAWIKARNIVYNNYTCDGQITDPYDPNYYQNCHYESIDTIFKNENLYIKTNDRTVKFIYGSDGPQLPEMSADIEGTSFFFDKSGAQGSDNKMALHFYLYNWQEKVEDSITFAVNSYDRAIYQFHYSMVKQEAVEEDPFSERVQVYSNVDNGLGILGSITPSRLKLWIAFPPKN